MKQKPRRPTGFGGVRRALRWVVTLAGAAVLLVAVFLCLAALTLRIRDPEPRIAARHGRLIEARVVHEQTVAGHIVRDVRLRSSSGLEVALKVKYEPNAETPRRPLVVILGGLRTGRDAVDLVDDTRGSVIAAVSYATSRQRLKSLGVTRGLPVARDTVTDSVASVLLALDWLIELPEVDPERVELVGVSLGGPFACVAGALDSRFTRVWSIHSGGRIDVLLHAALVENDVAAPVAFVISRIVGWSWSSVAPEDYVGRIAPRQFVLVNGEDDHTVPAVSIRSLYESANPPKQQEWLQGRHVKPTRREVIEQMMELVATYMDRDSRDSPGPGA